MDAAFLSGLAVFSGSVVGALSSLASAWLSKMQEDRAQRASANKLERQKIYAQFMDEASKLYVDALVRDRAEPSALVSIYALISKMRMASDSGVIENAENVVATVLNTYSQPNKTFPELRDLTLNRGLVDPLLTFSEICRDELRDLPPCASRIPFGPIAPTPATQSRRGGPGWGRRSDESGCGSPRASTPPAIERLPSRLMSVISAPHPYPPRRDCVAGGGRWKCPPRQLFHACGKAWLT
ncbi:MAG: hypothetical protein JO216_15830 [Hyphomicrobiales bacterium]|nr:hypothetical protein [Hyphomicrobiales bacterium]